MFQLRKLSNKILLFVSMILLLGSVSLRSNDELTEIFKKYEESIENRISEALKSNNNSDTINKRTVLVSVFLAIALPHLFNKMLTTFKVKRRLSSFKSYRFFKWCFSNK